MGKFQFWKLKLLDNLLKVFNLQLPCTAMLTFPANILQHGFTNRMFITFFHSSKRLQVPKNPKIIGVSKNFHSQDAVFFVITFCSPPFGFLS